mgnify:CR=1 FL=1
MTNTQSINNSGQAAFIPVEVYGCAASKKKKSGEVINYIKAWVCFYDTDYDALFTAFGKAGLPRYQSEFHEAYLSFSDAVTPNDDNAFRDRVSREAKKTKEGYVKFAGDWYIHALERFLVNLEKYEGDPPAYFKPRDVQINGFRHDPRARRNDPGATSKVIDPIAARLASVNPVAESWFFTA